MPLIDTHFHPISSGSALKWQITSQSCCSGNFPPPLLWLSNPKLAKPDLCQTQTQTVFRLSFKALSCTVIWLPCLLWRVMYSDIGRYGPHTRIWVTPLIRSSYSDMGYTTQLLWTGRCYNTRTPLNENANQCVSWYHYHLSLAKPRKVEKYFENIVCEIFNC